MDDKSAKQLMDKALDTGPNFKAIFQVKGRELTDFQVELLRVDPILDPIADIWP